MSDLDLSALRKVAEAASQGPWQDESTGLGCVGGVGHTVARYVSTGDRRHIATFDPPTVLALLDELETLRAQVGDG